jgi:hypothetical protein
MLPNGGWAYTFRHKKHGNLGRIVLQGVENQTHIACEVAGDPDDPTTKTRLDILKPLADELTEKMELLAGKGRSVAPPPRQPGAEEIIPAKLMQCLKCDANVAMLIFAEDNDIGSIEDAARLMYQKYSNLDIPTWVIGPMEGDGSQYPADILKVWPTRESIIRMCPDDFNPHIEKLQECHCSTKG